MCTQLRLMTFTEAAQILKVPETWLRKRAAAGLVPCTRLGRNVRFTEEHLREIVADGECAVVVLPPRGLTRRARRTG